MSYVESGTFSTRISETSGSTWFGRTFVIASESLRSATRWFAFSARMSMFFSIPTTYFPSCSALTSTLSFPTARTTSPTVHDGSLSSWISSFIRRTWSFSWFRFETSRRWLISCWLYCSVSSSIRCW